MSVGGLQSIRYQTSGRNNGIPTRIFAANLLAGTGAWSGGGGDCRSAALCRGGSLRQLWGPFLPKQEEGGQGTDDQEDEDHLHGRRVAARGVQQPTGDDRGG